MQDVHILMDKATKLAADGAKASKDKDIVKCVEVNNELYPLLKEIASLTGDPQWDKLAEEGKLLHAKYQQ